MVLNFTTLVLLSSNLKRIPNFTNYFCKRCIHTLSIFIFFLSIATLLFFTETPQLNSFSVMKLIVPSTAKTMFSMFNLQYFIVNFPFLN
ncbi:hypothetical protein Bhyg_11872 [Pseudolycoriella hygida]|uniref:Uncharacterized protein n=1 Tax=Pseudolycoriella hygida TaxID=35572 RepID=A0A9Q0MYM3_9DIPT|nr:hypothetical protein Bhyg_11872 [Pseudolycoriella hygida]